MQVHTLCICAICVGVAVNCLAGEADLNGKQTRFIAQSNVSQTPVYTVRVQVDGNLVGRVYSVRDNHRHVVAARIALSRNDRVVTTAETDESGYFQLVAVASGQYTGTAIGEHFASSFKVHALPFDETATPEEMILDVSLDPLVTSDETASPDRTDSLDDACPLCRRDVPIASSCGCAETRCGGFYGGGCCGHRSKWGLLGLAGLAGLDDDDKIIRVVSPFKPHSH